MSSRTKPKVIRVGDNIQNTEELSNPFLRHEPHVEELGKQLWKKQQKELYNKVTEYETALNQEKRITALLQKDLETRTEERDAFMMRAVHIEEFAQKSLKDAKRNHLQDTVAQTDGTIFVSTQVNRNQDLQIIALTQQVQSLKEIISITKGMLEIRSAEVLQLQNKVEDMEEKFSVEKNRHALMNAKLDKMIKLNAELKTEYEKQILLLAYFREGIGQHRETGTDKDNAEFSKSS